MRGDKRDTVCSGRLHCFALDYLICTITWFENMFFVPK